MASKKLIINGLEIALTRSVKSPPAPLCQRGVIPPFGKGFLPMVEMTSSLSTTLMKS
jgi:hypothetical protein